MERQPEPELMLEEEQVRAYAQADFNEPHSMFINKFLHYFPDEIIDGRVLDLGCGAADISCRVARAFPNCKVDGVDASETMLRYGREFIATQGVTEQVQLFNGYLPHLEISTHYDAVISNSLLHHLANPLDLWETVKKAAKPSGIIFIMDLLRPSRPEDVDFLVKRHAANEPEILRRDFFNSLHAAYTVEEIEAQLQTSGLYYLDVYEVSDRHWIALGRL